MTDAPEWPPPSARRSPHQPVRRRRRLSDSLSALGERRQTRDCPGAPGAPLTRSGGRSLRRCSRASTTSSRSTSAGTERAGVARSIPRRQWADEVLAVIEDARFVGAPVLIGHSMGGLVSIVARLPCTATRSPARSSSTRRCESPIPESQEGEAGKSFRNPKVYPTLEKAIEHLPSRPSAAVRERVHRRAHRAHVAPSRPTAASRGSSTRACSSSSRSRR